MEEGLQYIRPHSSLNYKPPAPDVIIIKPDTEPYVRQDIVLIH